MSLNTENKETTILERAESALIEASSLPYNNASSIYETAGLTPDPRMGGSCLYKLNHLRNSLPKGLAENAVYIASQVGNTTHYAMLCDIEGVTFYFDPFLWQNQLMSISNNQSTATTLEDIWTIKREQNEEGSRFVIAFTSPTPDGRENKLLIHHFNQEFDILPSSSAIPIKTDLPSFMMQIPDTQNQKFYKLWYHKKDGFIGDIWVVDGKTGDRKKVTHHKTDARLREQVIKEIENITGMSRQEMIAFFAKAHDLEISLSNIIPTLISDVPAGHQEDIG